MSLLVGLSALCVLTGRAPTYIYIYMHRPVSKFSHTLKYNALMTLWPESTKIQLSAQTLHPKGKQCLSENK